MAGDETRARLEELRMALRLGAVDGRARLQHLRRDSLGAGDAEVAALALWGIAQKELDLDRRAKLQRALVREYPKLLAYQALADSEICLGQLTDARATCRAALRLAVKADSRSLIRRDLREIERALEGSVGATGRLRLRRMQQERDLAITRSRFEPKAAAARLWRQRRKAAGSGDRPMASLFLAALVDVAQHCGDPHRAVRLARTLTSELSDVWTLDRLGDAERSAGLYACALKSYLSAAALAKQTRALVRFKAIQKKLRVLSAEHGH